MKKYYARKLEGGSSSLNKNFGEIAGREGFLVYFGQGVDESIEKELGFDNESLFIDDIGRGGGGITDWGEIYSAVKFMVTAVCTGVIGNFAYDLVKKYYKNILALFRVSKKLKQTLHFNIDVDNGSQFHFVFFSFFDEDDLKNAWNSIPDFVLNNSINSNVSVDCYFNTKSKEWHIVGQRELNHEHVAKYKIH